MFNFSIFIAFHDIVVHPPETNCDVNKFWNEIKYHYKYKEFVENWDQKKYGIGIIIKNNDWEYISLKPKQKGRLMGNCN